VPPLNDSVTRPLDSAIFTSAHNVIRYIAASCRGSDANTTAAAAADNDDDDASQCDVIATHPEHLLLSSMDSCPATRFLLYFITIVVVHSTLDSARSLCTTCLSVFIHRKYCTYKGQKPRCVYDGRIRENRQKLDKLTSNFTVAPTVPVIIPIKAAE